MLKFEIRCLVSGEETDGKVAVFEEIVPPGGGPPRHLHRSQIEIFHIIDGSFEFEVDGEKSVVGEGGTAVVQAGAVHAFRNAGPTAGTIHFQLMPAGKSEESFQKLVAGEVGDDLVAFFDRYDMELSGPPLGR